MKKIFAILTLAFVVVSCGGEKTTSVEDLVASNDLAQIRAKKS